MKYIIIKRRRNPTTSDNCTIRSTTFKRQNIHGLLFLLQITCKPWLCIEISSDRLSKWPEEGYLVELKNQVQIIYEDEQEDNVNIESNDTESVTNNSEITLDGDGDDYGPAPLQNDFIPDESFEGVIQLVNGNNARGSTGEIAEKTITNASNSMRGIDNTERQQQQSEQETSVVLQNPEVFQNDGFVDMNRTQFVWAHTFPSCYRPSYINIKGRMKWIIMNNITGFDSKHPCEKTFKLKD